MVRVLKKVAIAVGVITTKIGGSAVDDGFRRAVRVCFFPFLIMMVTMRLLLATV